MTIRIIESNKKLIVQIGKQFYFLRFAFEIKEPDELNEILEKYDVKLLKDR